MYETSCQSRFDARYWMLGAGALGRPRGMIWRGRREEGSGWGTHVYLWQIHFDIWQNQYNIVKFKKKKRKKHVYYHVWNRSPVQVRCMRQGARGWCSPGMRDALEGWDGEGGGKEGKDGEHMYTHGWFMSMYSKNHHNIISFQLK